MEIVPGGGPLPDSRIHQHIAPQNRVRLLNSSTYPPKRGPPFEFINQRGSASTFHDQIDSLHLVSESGFSPVRWDTFSKFGCPVLSGLDTHMSSPVEPYYTYSSTSLCDLETK